MRQAKTRNKQNVTKKEAYKKLLARCRRLIADKKLEDAGKMLSDIYQALDKAAKTKAIAINVRISQYFLVHLKNGLFRYYRVWSIFLMYSFGK